jgi:hypothetical protein
MDYGFAPGGTGYDTLARVLLKRRPATTVIEGNAITTVEAFIDHLSTDPAIATPIGDLLIASHGNDAGWMSIDLDSSGLKPDGKPANHTTFEVLEQSIAAIPKTVEIPAALHAAVPDPVPFDVHVLGCRIGQAPPFVKKLKDAFVTPRSVTAPKHFHFSGGVGTRKRLTAYASYEHLSYGFVVSRPNRSKPAPAKFKTKAEAVNAFDAQGFTYIAPAGGGAAPAVPRAVWGREIPKNLKSAKFRRYTNLGQNIGHNLTRFRLLHEFRNEVEKTGYSVSLAADPGNRAAREAKFQTSIRAHPLYQAPPAHEFPIYMRYGYNSLDEFLDGFAWTYNWQKKKKILVCTGSRRVYTVLLPIVEPGTLDLIFNLYPVAGSGMVQVTNLQRNDARLFLTV